jgi:hypothetical protein
LRGFLAHLGAPGARRGAWSQGCSARPPIAAGGWYTHLGSSPPRAGGAVWGSRIGTSLSTLHQAPRMRQKPEDQLRDQRSQNTDYCGSFKSSQCAPRPVFLRICRHVTNKQHFRSNFFAPRSWWSCSATASGSPAARAGDTRAHPTPTLDFFRAISAVECVLVSTVTLCGAKLNSMTPLGSVVLPLLKITM